VGFTFGTFEFGCPTGTGCVNRHATLAEGERCGCFTPSYVLFMTITDRKSMSEMAAVNVRARDRPHDSAIDSIFDQTGWKACLTGNVCVRSSGISAVD
jgi:hypothetical protein